jgi:hypothetical protein
MCRNIRTLYNFEPPATRIEIEAAALQFVRKLSGFNKPSQKNQEAFNDAVLEITRVASQLLESLETNSPPRDRMAEQTKAQERARKRFGTS